MVQDEPLGTAHAVAVARPLLEDFDGDVLVLYADTPLVRGETLERLIQARRGGPGVAAAVLGFRPEDPAEYGRLILAPDGTLARIVEYAEASEEERAVSLCNAGMMAIDGRRLFSPAGCDRQRQRGRRVLSDRPAGHRYGTQGGVCAVAEAPAEEVMGINDRVQLAAAERVIQDRLRRAAMEGGCDARRSRHRLAQPRHALGLRRDHRAQRRDRPWRHP